MRRRLFQTKNSLICALFLAAFLFVGSIITPAIAESKPSQIKETKTRSLNPQLFTQQDVLETIVSQINETRFKWFDSILANNIGPRRFNSENNIKAAEFIAEELNSTKSLSVTYQWFTFAGREIANVVGTLPSANPNNESKIVVGAHFDTVTNSPGADDNGSGTALLLEVAKVLSQFKFNCTIEFVAFNAEEEWLIGSDYYVQQASQAGEDILLMINIDMCIWDNPNAPPHEKLWIVYQEDPYENCERFADVTFKVSSTYTPAPIQKISNYNKTYFPFGAYRSDHASFWSKGIPALWIFEFNGFQNPYYHRRTDTMDALGYNFTLGAQAAQVVAATIAKLAQPRILQATGWGWMRIGPKQRVWGRTRLYKIGETQIELIITYEGSEYSRRWNIIYHRKFKYVERYRCRSEEWGVLVVGLHKHRRWQFWYAVGKGVVVRGFSR